ncbi:MAG: hypothetical protein IPK74_14570 [Deltaproteobacteria bacterium]|nr:hypothetical protein [Deltaproteobacteria bacterium]
MPPTSMTQPLERLGDATQRFVRSDGLRLLCVEVDAAVREGAVMIAMAAEHLADNRSPLVPVRLPGCRDLDGDWEQATDMLRQTHEQLREAGAPLAPLAERPLRSQGSASLAAQLLQCLGTVRAPAQGLLYLWLPTPTAFDLAWLGRVGDMLGSPRLAAAKSIVLLPRDPGVAAWHGALAPEIAAGVMHHVCAVERAVAIAELAAEIDAESRMGVGKAGAWPAAARPPARPWLRSPAPPPTDAPPPAVAAAELEPRPTAAAAVEPAANDAPTASVDARLRLHLKRAVLAQRREDGPTAVSEQAAARDLCIAHDRVREAIDMELVLGAYLVEFGQAALAIEAFDRAAARASTAELWRLAALAHLAAAATHDRTDAAPAALASHRHAIAAATHGRELDLLFRAYWEAGRIALRLELIYDAVALLGDAFILSQPMDPAELRGTRARDVIAELCQLLARCRRFSEAREVERALARLESA